MLLRVGELAKRTGLTVRALHHYDTIGLLQPTVRSDGGYRLYSREDVARLHSIQTMRRMGLALAEIAQLLDGVAVALPDILARQMDMLDEQIAQAQALRERLGVMQSILENGGQPEIGDWLASLSKMNTFEQYFGADELKLVFERWKRCKAEWPPLLQAVREAMERQVAPDAIELQPLARRWMDVSARWMNGDMALLKRWGTMLREQPSLPLPSGMDRALLEYIDQAVQLRLAALARHISADDLQRLDKTLEPEWRELSGRAKSLMDDGASPDSARARQLARDWQNLLDRMTRHDDALRARLLTAYEKEPLLQAGVSFAPEVREYVRRAALTLTQREGGRCDVSAQRVHPMSALSNNLLHIGETSRTALRVASLRAVHQLLDEPLVLVDPIALPLLGAATEAALRNDPFALNDPMSRALRGGLVARSRLVEDELSRCVAAGVRQYLVLGAGLDTFGYRNPYDDEGLLVFEVDLPSTQLRKQQMLVEAGIAVPASVKFVAADLERDDLVRALRRAGFRADQAVCASWMGVTMYLSVEAVARTLRTLSGFAAGSCLCFDYRVLLATLDPVERVVNEVLGQRIAALGEPWLSAFDPSYLRRQLLELGFSTATSATPHDLNVRYFARRKDGLCTGGGIQIMCATK